MAYKALGSLFSLSEDDTMTLFLVVWHSSHMQAATEETNFSLQG